jgi:hypothetical protein
MKSHRVCTLQNLGMTIDEMMEEYRVEVNGVTDKSIRKVTKQTTKVIEAIAPIGYRGVYHVSLGEKFKRGATNLEGTVWGAKNHAYSLGHLLENGHFLWNRPTMPSGAYKHWVEGERFAQDELPEEIVSGIEKI